MADTTARPGAGRAGDGTTGRAIVAAVWPAAAILLLQVVLFPIPFSVALQGAVLGLLNAMVVLGLILVYRANRVINFAQASIGTFPASLAAGVVLFGAPTARVIGGVALVAGIVVLLGGLTVGRLGPVRSVVAAVVTMAICAGGLQVAERLGWFGGLAVGVVTAIVSGIGIDAIVIRRMRHSPRLVVAVATIGLAQLFAVLGLLSPRLWNAVVLVDREGSRTGFEVPGDFTLTIGSTIFGSAELVAVAISLASIALVSLALRRTGIGMAVRAAADSGDRASMLGVPVPRIEAGVWIVAAVLAFLATYAQAGILGLELTAGVGLRVMVAALGAMAIGGFRSTPRMLFAAVAIGVLAQATGPAGGHSLTLTDAVLAGVVLVGLLLQRSSNRRSDRDAVSSWQATAEPRAIPFELARLPLLKTLRVVGVVALVAIAAALPLVMGESEVLRGSVVIALAVVVLSVVVLTGWTGEVTLGQMAFAASGAAVAAYTTLEWRFDFALALVAAGAAGALVAVVVALPALRWQGIFLAVTTLAFSLAAVNYLLNPTVATWIPTEDISRRPLLGIIDMGSRTTMYEVALAIAVLCLAGVAGIRRTRVGRTLRAVRDNKVAAQAFGVRVPVARLSAFGLSGFLAGVGGALLFAINERYEVGIFTTNESLSVFISAVVGGVGSLVGAVLGAVILEGSRIFLSGPAALLPSAVGVLGVLLLLPGGLAELVYRLRDNVLRSYANRRRIHVPSLVADRRVVDPKPQFGAEVIDLTEAALIQAMPSEIRAEAPTQEAVPTLTPPGRPEAPTEAGWLSVRGLDVAYDKVQVLFDVDIDIPQGQITALLGTNGAGKSTLLKAIGGVAPVTAGTLRLGHVDLARLRPEQVPAHGIVQMPGGHGVFPSLTVDENLRVAAWLFRKDRADANRRIQDARARFEILEARRDDQAADLSGGQQQQLALAMALLARPKLLLVDELSLGLAPVMVENLLGELRALRDQGTTIVVVEQSVNVALSIADHAYFMEKGEVRFSGAAQDLLAQPDLVRAVFLQGAREALAGNGQGPQAAGGTRPAWARASGARAPGARAPGARPGGGEAPGQDVPPALEVRDLSVSFGGITAVDNVGFSVLPGEVIGLIGPNGAGKTTIVDLISGFTPADSGLVLLHGQDLSSRRPSYRARHGLGRSFQDARLFPGLTVAETIGVSLERWIEGDDLVSAAFRLPSSRDVERDIADRTDELVDLFGLQAFRSKRIGDLSTGSRRMVDLACVVAHRPSVVLLDEPTSGIAQREAEALGPVLLGLRDRLGATLLVIEHDISLISSISDRLVALDQGTVVTVGRPAEVLGHRDVVASYLGTGGESLRRSDHAMGGSR
jgi:ABC-type branched-subunit amino acid transport system ATPase component/ABC-type branched-subunit amino acid transport system permease subunit